MKPAQMESVARPDVARGVIVRAVGIQGVASARAATDAMGMDVAATRAVTAGASLFLFDEVVPADEARAVAARLAARPDVLWAEADVRVYPTATPYIPNDPYFPEMTDLWNGGGAEDYSVKAPLVWGEQRGSASVVVAILDTGITSHPDLDANVVSGYDFVSDVAVANDGDARDPDPADPGDWITPAEASYGEFQGCTVANSSWHGTHVAGTVAAVQGNALGVTGIAPEARIQSVRVMGKCGGYVSDIAAGITWASGGSVPGVPANPTPAKVLNMSLGGTGTCSAGSLYGASISGAIARGATVVVAAGNENESLANHPPANCASVRRRHGDDTRAVRRRMVGEALVVVARSHDDRRTACNRPRDGGAVERTGGAGAGAAERHVEHLGRRWIRRQARHATSRRPGDTGCDVGVIAAALAHDAHRLDADLGRHARDA